MNDYSTGAFLGSFHFKKTVVSWPFKQLTEGANELSKFSYF